MAPLPRTPTKDRSSMLSTQSETPIQPKVAHAAASAPGHLGTAAKRENMLIDLGQSVPQVPIEWFTGADGILPPLHSDIDLEQVMSKLRKGEHLNTGKISKPEHWSSFGKLPSDQGDHVENVVFRPVEHITNAIQKASGVEAFPTLFFRCNPDMSPDSSTRPDNKTKPDAYGIIANPQIDPARFGKPRWIDVAVPGEFKKTSDGDKDVDVSSFSIFFLILCKGTIE